MLLLWLAAGCGGEGTTGPTRPGNAVRIALVGTPATEARSGSPLEVQPVLQLLDAAGAPVPAAGVTVTASASGGGTLTGNSIVTASDGRAAFTALTLRGTAGARTLSFAASGLAGASHALTLMPGPAARIMNQPATSQVAIIGSAVPIRPAVRITDADLNPIADVPVTFAAAPGHGTIAGESTTSDANGIATLQSWVIPSVVGTYSVTAASPGLSGSPVTFTAQAVTLMPSAMLAHAGQDQSVTASGTVPIPPAVRVTSNLQPAMGIPVQFAVTAGGGTIAGAEQLTDAEGIARVESWTLGALGPNTLTATIPGSALAPVTFTATSIGIGHLAADPLAPQVLTGAVLHPRVRVTAPGGAPLAGVAIAFAVTAGGGSVASGQQVTDAQGYAAPAGWTMGGAPGVQRLSVSAPAGFGNSPLVLEVRAYAKLAARAAIHAGNGQTGPVGQPLPVKPAIRLTADDGSPVPGWPVTFVVLGGSGSLADASTETDANGIATAGSWTLNIHPGQNQVEVFAAGTPLTFVAQAVAGPPSQIDVGSPTAGLVGRALDPVPAARVTDALGNPIAGVPVSFAIAGGGGSLTGGSQVTDADGYARPASWSLGIRPGLNLVTVTAQGLATAASLVATGHAGPVTQMLIVSGDGQSALLGQRLPVDPRVEVRDPYDNPVPSARLRFTPLSGGGSVTATDEVLSNAAGQASTGWTLGLLGTNTLRAAAIDDLQPSVTFTATATQPSDPYDIEIRYLAAPSLAMQTAVQNAITQWSGIIVNGLPSQGVALPAGSCFTAPGVNETVDDLVIFVETVAIDGVGGVLGGATSCAVRGSGFPVVGFMRFDVADIADMTVTGELGDVVLHEIGHVLGFGTLWPSFGLLAFGPEPYFTGAYALQSYRALGGTSAQGPGVPVENTGGAGTANAHWRETVFGNELMTGYILGADNRLTAITISSLRDMGYQVSYTLAEPLGTPLSLRRDGAATPRQIRELRFEGSIFVFDEAGRVKATIPRIR
ncbi:MAG: Ig-like domain-containing protein [Gemmatimonadota bacterium]